MASQFRDEIIDSFYTNSREPALGLGSILGLDTTLYKLTNFATPLGKEGGVVWCYDQDFLITTSQVVHIRTASHSLKHRECCTEANECLSHSDFISENL